MDPLRPNRADRRTPASPLDVIAGGAPTHATDRGARGSIRCADAILLTGATGSVGGALLTRLMDRDQRPIVCLIGATSERDAQRCGRERLESLLGRSPSPEEERRVDWIRADLEQVRFGLNPFAFIRLAARIGEIFHCAAAPDLHLPLERAQRINVAAVEDLLALARTAGRCFRRFHHLSTAYVSGRVRRRVTADYLPTDRVANFRNPYERTRARAERLLRSQQDVPVTIYRPSILAGDTESGWTDDWNGLYVPMQEAMKGRLPFLCRGGKAILDSVGVDFVADGILTLAEHPAARIQAYHLTADRLAFDVERYVWACNRAARASGASGAPGEEGLRVETRTVGRFSWLLRASAVACLAWAPPRLARLRRIGRRARRGISACRPYLAYTRVDTEFEAGREHQLLRQAGVRMPDPDIYLERIVEYALSSDFGRAAPRSPRRARVEPHAGAAVSA